MVLLSDKARVLFLTGILLCWSPPCLSAATLSEERVKYLKTETLQETGFPPDRFRRIFSFLMSDVIRDDPDLAANLVLHTDRLIRRDQEENPDTYFNPLSDGESHITRFLEYYEDQTETIDAIGVMVRTYREDRAGVIPYAGFVRFNSRYALLSQFLRHGGNYDMPGGMEALLSDLRTACGEGNSIFLAPFFNDLANLLRPAQRTSLARWATEKINSTDRTVSSLAESILLGLSLFERTNRVSIDFPELPRGNALDLQIQELLSNESLSPAWRLGMASFMGGQFRDRLSPSVKIECGELLAACLNKQPKLHFGTLNLVLAAFLRGSDRDAEWRSTGRALLDTLKRIPKPSADQLAEWRISEKFWIVQTMDLVCRVGSNEEIQAHFRKYRYEDSLFPGLWITLIRHEKFALANELFEMHGDDTAFSSGYYYLDTCYNRKLESMTPRYLASIADEETRLFAQLLLAAVIDPKVPGDNDSESTQETRLASFAREKSTMPAWKDIRLIRALEIFSLTQNIEEISDWLVTNEVGLENRIEQETPRLKPYWAGRIEMHNAVEQLENGQSFPAQMMWGRSVFEKNPLLERKKRDLAEAILDMVDGRLRNGCQDRDLERLRKFLPFSRQVLETVPQVVSSGEVHRFAIRVITAHAICEQMPAWTTWWDQLEPVQKRRLISILEGRRDFMTILRVLLNEKRLPAEQAIESTSSRRRIVREILSTDWLDQAYPGVSVLSVANANGLLTEQDIYEISGDIAEQAPRKGSGWREHLGAMSDRGLVLEALFELEKIMEQEEAARLTTALSVEKWLILKSLGRVEEAGAIERQLTEKELLLPIEYQAIINYLKRR